jgi:putative ABC transport system substrate-binding protein
MAASSEITNRPRCVGFLASWVKDNAEGSKRFDTFKFSLQELGWAEGRNLKMEVRFGNNSDVAIHQAAGELVELGCQVLVSTTSTTTRALVDAGKNIPIVAAVSGDPVALGFTKDLSHPTGNVTGFTTFNDTLAAKRFQMLHEIVPTMRKVALMWISINPQQALLETQTREAANAMGIELASLPIQALKDVPAALAKAQGEQASAIIIGADPMTVANARAISEACISMKMPAMHTFVSEAKNGALMSYGIDIFDSYRRAADYVDRILKGAGVADLPFQEPTRFTLAINLQTARAIGVKVPSTLLALADEIIE